MSDKFGTISASDWTALAKLREDLHDEFGAHPDNSVQGRWLDRNLAVLDRVLANLSAKPSTCDDVDLDLASLSEGKLSDVGKQRLVCHLVRCNDCRNLADEYFGISRPTARLLGGDLKEMVRDERFLAGTLWIEMPRHRYQLRVVCGQVQQRWTVGVTPTAWEPCVLSFPDWNHESWFIVPDATVWSPYSGCRDNYRS